MDIGHLARKHVVEERNHAQDKWSLLHQMEDTPVKEFQWKPKIVVRKFARSTVNGGLMKHGLLALKHAVEERNHAQDKWPCQHQMEGKIVKETLWKPKLVMRKVALSTVNGDLMEHGRLAHKHAVEERNYAQDK